MSEELSRDPSQRIHLSVLPHSGKIDKLRADMMETPPPLPSADPPEPAAPAPVDVNQPPLKKLIEGKVIAALQTVFDPEIPVNIYELGLIYGIDVDETSHVKVTMTLTSPACPVAGSLPGEVEKKIESIPEVTSAEVDLTWDPPWSKDRMSEVAMLQLGMF